MLRGMLLMAAIVLAAGCAAGHEKGRTIGQDTAPPVLGELGLTEEEEWAVVAFLQTLSDGWVPDAR